MVRRWTFERYVLLPLDDWVACAGVLVLWQCSTCSEPILLPPYLGCLFGWYRISWGSQLEEQPVLYNSEKYMA